MGSISGVVKSIDTSEPMKGAAEEALEALDALGQTKVELFRAEIEKSLITAGSDQDRKVPIEAVLDNTAQTHAYHKDNVEKIGSQVKDALSSFCSGSQDKIIDGVSNLISNALEDFLGSAEASEDTLDKYVVLTEEYSIIRLDLRAWQRKVKAEGIRTNAEKVSAFVMVKSAVDLKKIGFNTFLYLYRGQLNAMDLDKQDIEKALDRAAEIYTKFHADILRAQQQDGLLTELAGRR